MGSRILLKLAKDHKNYTMEGIAKELNISTKQYSNYENGKTKRIPEQHKEKISELLNIDKELIDIREGAIVITGNSIKNGSASVYSTNHYSSEFSEKKIEELDIKCLEIIIQKKEEQLEIKDKMIDDLQFKLNSLR